MYRLFSKKFPFRGEKVSQKFIQAKFKFADSLDYATQYYQTYNQYLSNQHILVRMLAGFDFDADLPDSEIYRYMESMTSRICSSLGITCYSVSGHIFKKGFYTNNCAIVSCSFSDPLHLPHWKHIRAVRVLTHPHVTMELVLPHRLRSVDDEDYSVVGIDIPLLAIQFKHWVKLQQSKPVNERDEITTFVYKWVLTGMLPEQIDISLRNRIQHIALGTWREEPNIKPPFFVQDYDKEFDRAIRDLIKYYRTGERTMSEVMIGMPMFTADDYWEAVPKNLDSLSLYSYWIRLLVYTDWLYPVAAGFIVDGTQELVARNLTRVNRYVIGSHADKFIEAPINTRFEEKYNAIMTMWT